MSPKKDDSKPWYVHAKEWLWLFVSWNWKKYALYVFVVVLPILVRNWTNDPNDPDEPIPPPPIPDWIQPPDGWLVPSEDDVAATMAALKTPRFRNTEAGRVLIVGDSDYPLWRLAIKGRGQPIPTRDQSSIGSCVSFGFGSAGEYTMAAQVATSKQRQTLPDFCQEAIYGGSRFEANNNRLPLRSDGSTGAWAAKWLEKVGGYLPRGKYGSLDLTSYSVPRCREWGNRGVPDELEPEARTHKAHCTLVSTIEEAKSALSQGYAIAICSNVGFEGQQSRDKDGFLRESGNWGHCMCCIGYRAGARPGFLILNSWGTSWVGGPKGEYSDTPDGSFWIEPTAMRKILSQGDSYAVANAEGFRKRVIDPADWVVHAQPQQRPDFAAIGGLYALAP